jgi:hypothetical protein
MFHFFLYFFWLALQNLALPWLYRQGMLPAEAVAGLMAAKEVFLLAALMGLAPRALRENWRFSLPDGLALTYLGVLAGYLCLGPRLLGSTAPLMLRAISARSLASPALFYFWGRLTRFSLRDVRRFLWFVAGLQAAVAAFGLFEWLFLPTSFWSDSIGVGAYMLDIKGLRQTDNVLAGLPSNMFRFGVRRVISSYAEPLAMGIASVFPLLLCAAWGMRRGGQRCASRLCGAAGALIAAALLLTIARESIAAAAFGLVLVAVWSGQARRVAVPLLAALAGLLLLPRTWEYVASTLTFQESSAALHLQFLEVGWKRLPTLLAGKGLGEAGGWAFSLAGVESEVGENSYLELMSQTGLLSVLLFCGFLGALGRQCWNLAEQLPEAWIAGGLLAAAAHILARCLAGMFSPSLFGVVPLASFFFFCGAAPGAVQRARHSPFLRARRVLVLRQLEPMPAKIASGLS